MQGLMMQQPLLVSALLTHAERHHARQEVVSRRVEGDIHRTTYAEIASRSRRMAKALAASAVAPRLARRRRVRAGRWLLAGAYLGLAAWTIGADTRHRT